ncbi:MAG: histone H1 [Paludibacteraceae bacterium]|nr:histone H1 [Paludibacteraceae bacterium]
MEKLFATLDEKMKFFAENAAAQVKNGNKAAGMRARKASLEIEKLMKEFRKVSIAAAK